MTFPTDSQAKPSHEVMQAAAHWYARLGERRSDPLTRQDWAQWHAADPMHRQAWAYVERISQRFEALQPCSDTSAKTLLTARDAAASRRQVLRTLAICSGGALLSWLAVRHSGLPRTLMAWNADQRTAIGELRNLTLSDGTRLWLNSASAVDIDYNPSRRTLHLLAGEILVQTASDRRPFFVQSREGLMQALGTRFSVQQQDQRTRLNVFEGAVRVSPAAGATGQVVESGQQLGFGRMALGPLTASNPLRESWSSGRLRADNMRLADFIDELSHYRAGHLGVAPEVADLLVMGTYPLHDSDQALGMLESALPISVQRTLPWWVTVNAR